MDEAAGAERVRWRRERGQLAREEALLQDVHVLVDGDLVRGRGTGRCRRRRRSRRRRRRRGRGRGRVRNVGTLQPKSFDASFWSRLVST